MHTEMWEHAATRANVATLRSRGVVVIEPAVGRLTGADSGAGRLPEPERDRRGRPRVLARGTAGAAPDLAGRRVVVSAGGTREAARPGAIPRQPQLGPAGLRARADRGRPRRRGHAGRRPTWRCPTPPASKVVRVDSADELRAAVLEAAADADAVVMAAAVADFRPVTTRSSKIKKTDADAPTLD